MYFISYLTDFLSMTNFFYHPQTFNSAKFKKLDSFSKAPCDHFEIGGNLSSPSLCVTDNWLRLTSYITSQLLSEQV